MYQTGKNIRVSLAPEATFNTPPATGTATELNILPGAGLKLSRTLIENREVRSDGQSSMGRLGARSVSGGYPVNLKGGSPAIDLLLAAVLRGTFSGTTLTPAIPPVSRSFTFEEYEQDIDAAEVFSGCRVASLRVSLAPDGMATGEFGVVGTDLSLLSGAAAPYFVAPAASPGEALVATDAAITLGGTPVLDFTACDFTIDLGGAGQPVIGSTVTPDVFLNNMRISGTISALRADVVRQQAFLDETELALVLTLVAPAPATATLSFTIPRIKFTDFSAGLGDDGAVVATLPFVAGKPDASNMVTVSSIP